MKFDMVTIKNFRNFENISVALTNKNVLFGMKLVDCLEKCLIYGHIRRFAD